MLGLLLETYASATNRISYATLFLRGNAQSVVGGVASINTYAGQMTLTVIFHFERAPSRATA